MSPYAGARNAGRAERRDQIRHRLLQAVDELTVAGESYATVSIERLASTAGISRATFYTYFDGKGDLLRAWFGETLDALHDACLPWLDLGPDASPDALATALGTLIGAYRARATLMSAVNDEATQDSALRARLDAAIDRTAAAVKTQIERGQRDGWVDPELLPAETAAWLVWLIERGLGQILPTTDDAELASLTETLAQMGWQVLRADGSDGR